MRRVLLASATALALSGATLGLPTAAPAAPQTQHDGLEVYTGTLSAKQVDGLRDVGLDHGSARTTRRGDGNYAVEAVLSGEQLRQLAGQGITLQVKKVRGKAASEELRQQGLAGWKAFRSFSEPGGLRDEIAALAARYPGLTKTQTIGTSVNGKPIIAIKVTKDARKIPDGKRPAVMYASTQHAREWITPEMNRRLLHHILSSYGTDDEITAVVDTTELWFIPVVNPDGYDYTFTPGNRLWRKNLRDNNGDGKITTGDGVDPNRNFPTRWGYDNEGSSPNPSSDTYRGPKPASEPETRALDKLFGRIPFRFFVNYHSAAELLLYGTGWQVSTPTPDDVVWETLAGDDKNPAVPGYDPDISAELYTTNGETTEHMSVKHRTLGVTPEMSTCETAANWFPDDQWKPEDCVSGFVFPDDEKLIEMEFRKNIPFALSLAKSAKDPGNPFSSINRVAPDFVPDTFAVSYGVKQPVAATVKRSLASVKLNFRINGGKARAVATRAWKGGERYGGDNNRYYDERRGVVTGARAGDRVEAWFTGVKGKGRNAKKVASASFTYQVHTGIGGDVLVLAVEDVTGASPTQEGTSAKHAAAYVAAAKAAGHRPDVYDFDTQGRRAPHPLGVLSHYKAVVWETGDDAILRAPGQPAGTAAKAALDTELAVRDYLNEGGKLLVSGQNALLAQASDGQYSYDPSGTTECVTAGKAPCLTLGNDFVQYYLGAHTYVDNAGADGDKLHPVAGNAGAFAGFAGVLNAEGSAKNQTHSASFLPTSSFLPPQQFPHFGGQAVVDWKRPGPAPFDPYDGAWYVRSADASQSYQRLSRTVDLTGASAADLKFWASYDTEASWDFLFVEAREAGTGAWTTLPDRNGATTDATGESCKADIADRLHPQLKHYMGADCSAKGTTGVWNAATGKSNGWKEWSVDLSPYAGKKVELSITSMTDWGTQGLGVFLDQARVTADGAPLAGTSFETDLGGWTTPGAPTGSPADAGDYTRSQLAFDEGAVVSTADTVLTGFGLEGLAPAQRADFLARAFRHLKVKPGR
ncbi:M14 family metallopeptidase [Pilimelia columellifera]|uniref:M14 family metallopeptidase n=1 Tax=Pilimelia columellifera subsp. columellifera TaxID=706583 RepID=A0ABP6B046_9ACTN